MKSGKKSIAALLAALMSTSVLAACGDESTPSVQQPAETNAAADNGEAAVETEAETEGVVYKADIPEGTDFGGYTFRFLHWYNDAWAERVNKDLVAEEMNGELLNDAVYERNARVMEQLNIKITADIADLGQIGNNVSKAVKAGDDQWDAVYIRLYEAPSYLSSGIFLNYFNIPTLELENPWWDQSSVEQLSIDGQLYIVASDINIIDKNATAGLAFNKTYAESYGLPNLYQTVRDGEWTIDKIVSLYQDTARDLDGDGEMGLNDQYGFLSKNDAREFFFHGSNGRFVTKDEDDIPQFAFATEKNYNIASKIVAMEADKNSYFNQHFYGTDVVSDMAYTNMFANGQGLFFLLRLDDIEFMRSSDTDFGVLPIPKYDAAQDYYYSTVSQHTSGLMSIPITISDPSMDGMILEALAAESKNLVQPAYYDINMTTKYTRDTESGEMLQLIMQHRVYDLGCIYAFGDFVNQYQNLITKGSTDFASLSEKYGPKVTTAIEKVVAKYAELEG